MIYKGTHMEEFYVWILICIDFLGNDLLTVPAHDFSLPHTSTIALDF